MMLIGDSAFRHHVPFSAADFDPAKMAVAFGHVFGPWFKTGAPAADGGRGDSWARRHLLVLGLRLRRGARLVARLQNGVREAPAFYGTYVACVALGGGAGADPAPPLQLIIVSVQVLAGVMLPSAIIFLQLLNAPF